jgi:hypothetical protein
MQIEKLDPPEVLTEGGLTANLTHKKTTIRVDPSDESYPITVTESKGYLREDGSFKDYGPHTSFAMDREGYAAFVKESGGDCKLSELKPAIERRIAALKKAAEEAEKKRLEEQAAANARAQADTAALAGKTTVNRSAAKPAGADVVKE